MDDTPRRSKGPPTCRGNCNFDPSDSLPMADPDQNRSNSLSTGSRRHSRNRRSRRMNLLEELAVETEVIVLEDKLRKANQQLGQAFDQNEKLLDALCKAREQVSELKDEVDKLCAPPSTYGVYLSANQ